jgi:hypothetical protein
MHRNQPTKEDEALGVLKKGEVDVVALGHTPKVDTLT